MKINTILKGIIILVIVSLLPLLLIHYDFFLLNPDKAIAYIESFHPYDDIVFIALQALQSLSAGIIPGAVTEFAGGYLYGAFLGTIYSTAGLTIGSCLAFLLARSFGPLVRRIVMPSMMEEYHRFTGQRDTLMTFILFLVPGSPKAALSYWAGLGRMNIWLFTAVSTIGRLFGTAIFSIYGSYVRHNQNDYLLIMMGLLAISLLLSLLIIYRKILLSSIRTENITRSPDSSLPINSQGPPAAMEAKS
jgi:uncharacterized membrane protein YdjX (TVP38/TMEM64 family)